MLELHDLTRIHALAEANRDHKRNRQDAARGLDDLSTLLDEADGALPAEWLDRVRYIAAIIRATVIR